MNKKEAFKRLGLKEDASRSDIEKRYAIILRKYRGLDTDGEFTEGTFNEITEAYNLLMGYKYEVNEDELKRKKPSPLLQKLGINEEKLRNNLYYFKIHIIVGILVLITVIFSIRGCINRVDPDLHIIFLGEIYCGEIEFLEEDIKAKIPEVEAVGIENILISRVQEQQDPQVQMAMLQKAGVLMAVGDIDVFITDEANFEIYSEQGAFIKLDEFILELNIDEERFYRGKIKEEDRDGNISIVDEGVYGINVKDSKMLVDSEVSGKEMIAVISMRAKHYENSVEFIRLLLDSTIENDK